VSFWLLFKYYINSIIFLVPVQRDLKKPSIGKEYFKHMNLEAIVTNYPYRKNLPKEDIAKGQLPEKAGNIYSTWFCYYVLFA